MMLMNVIFIIDGLNHVVIVGGFILVIVLVNIISNAFCHFDLLNGLDSSSFIIIHVFLLLFMSLN